MSIDMSQFYQAFFEEAEELLAQAEHLLLDLNLESPDPEDLNAIFRAAHSIKGGAATFGMTDMAEITHVLENLLDKIRKNEMALTADHVDVFLAAKDVLNSQLEGHRSGTEVDRSIEEAVKERLKDFYEGQATPKVSENKVEETSEREKPVDKVSPETSSQPKVKETLIHNYRVEIAKLNDKDSVNLQEELGLLGEVSHKRLQNGNVEYLVKTEDDPETIITICTFIVEPEDITITEAKDASSAKVEAVNTMNLETFYVVVESLDEKDIANMKSELAILGEVAYSRLPNGSHEFSLKTSDGQAEIISICSFIVAPEKLKISNTSTDESRAKKEDKPSTNYIEEDGFGLFEPLPEPVNSSSEPLKSESVKEAKEDGLQEGSKDKMPAEVKTNQEVIPAKTEVVPPAKAAVTAKKETEKAGSNNENTSIRVGIEKVDQLINLVGELVITQAMIEQRVSKLDPIQNEDLVNSIGQLTRNTRDLQEAVMSIRMMPMDYVFSRFPRMVRDLANKLNKKVEFVTNGAATELDKGLIERIIDPLTHLVRNSIDHGIEIPEKRKESGKSEVGRLALSASSRGGNIVIEVSDDGAGLNRERILSKARQNGLPVNENMTDNEVWQLIFAPGFSTAEVVTDVSGRGVGMDVVKRNVSAMGGSIDIRSAPGYGTTMSISLPLTLAILDGMSISLGASIYVVPLNLIVETMQPKMEDIKTVTGEGLMINVRGEYLPIIPLYALFNQDTEIMHPTEGVLVILEAEGKKAALFVDGLVGQQQVVIKSLETNFKKIQGVSGATIMGDGSVALILDVPAIIKMGQNNSQGVYQ